MRYYELGGQSQWSLWVKWTVYFFFFKHCVLVFRVPELFVNSESVRSELRLQYRKRSVSAWWDDGTVEKQVWDFRSLLRKHTDNLEEKNCHCLSTNHNYEVYVEGFAWGACDFYEKGAKWSLCKQSKPLHRFSIFPFRALQMLYQNIKVA